MVESQRRARGRVVQRHVLYLGEINDSQRAAWEKTLTVFDEQQHAPVTCAWLPQDGEVYVLAHSGARAGKSLS